MRVLAFENRAPTASVEPSVLTMEWPSYPASCEDNFWSCATLDDVLELTVCRAARAEGRPHQSIITGLVWAYASGRQSAVGLVRLDTLEASMRIDQATGFWLCLRYRAPPRIFRVTGMLPIADTADIADLVFAKPRKEEGWYDMHLQ
ncbi:hypothetical protein ARSEF4850_002419 [Beauveria asiatica]